MAGVITASEPSWIAPFTGLSRRCFGTLVTVVRRKGADAPRRGRPWSLPLEDRILLVAAYWRTNLTMRQLAPLFGVSKSAADRIIDDLGPLLALQPRRRFRTDTVLIADGGYLGTGLFIPHRREPGQAELERWREKHNASHRRVRSRIEHVFDRMKSWKILRDCRLEGDGVHHAMLGIARLHNLALVG